jgi:hypothetical protein
MIATRPFDYNTHAVFEQSTTEIVDHARSFIASLAEKREESKELHILK